MNLTAPTRGEQTRAAILQAAYDLFVKQGYHGTSMRQIATQTGTALSGLYNHFPSKQAVFEAVYLAYHPYHQVFPMILAAQGDTLEQLVQDAFNRMMQVVKSRPDFMNLMFIEVVEFNSVHAQQLFASIFPQGMQFLQHLVESFPGQVRSIPPPMVVRTFLSLFFGYYLSETILAPGAPEEFRENAMGYFIEVFLHGVLVGKEQ